MGPNRIITLVTLVLAVVLTSASPLFQPIPLPADAAWVDLNYTRYVGTKLSNGVNALLGMRYAAARWEICAGGHP